MIIMKEKLEFAESKALFFIANGIMWITALVWLYVFINIFDPYDIMWWLAAILIYGSVILVFVGSYLRCMSKITIDENGIEKRLFKKYKRQYISWEKAKDYVVITRPNGYPYLAVSMDKITEKSFGEVLKNKKIIFFTYRQDAYDIISEKVNKID